MSEEAVRQEDPAWPAHGWDDDMRPALARARAAGRPCALATLIATEGSTPRPRGAQMVIDEEVVGHFSGGCVEGDVALHGRACIADGEARRLVYGRGSPWQDIRLACGGRLEILVERIAPDDPAVGEVLRLARARRPAVLAGDGATRAAGESVQGLTAPEGGYRRTYFPTTRLVVVGRDPTALAFCALGLQIGFEVVLVSPGGPSEPPFLPGLDYLRDSPAAAFARIELDRWTAVAVATHESELDEAALAVALPSPAAYVGALGARSRMAERRRRLAAAGVPPEALARLHAPIGRPGFGKGAWAIAVSAVSEILQEMSRVSEPE